jgi:DNA-binding GntR family transcriptional regulator
MSSSIRPIVLARHREEREPPTSLADTAYVQVKQNIFDFQLVPGDRFSETEIAEQLGMSRTPVREALARLQREGYLEVHFRSGWSVKPFDFEMFEHLYDLRMVLETTAVRRVVDGLGGKGTAEHRRFDAAAIEQLKQFWLVPKAGRLDDWKRVGEMDEAFHITLVEAGGNPELARVHREVTERIRIVRRLDFTQPVRVDKTYDEHAQILRAILGGRVEQAVMLLRTHIEVSKAEVRKITLHRLYLARDEHAVR